MSEALARLQQHFGFSQFRPGQQAVIDAVSQGQDALVIMPTGGGKSLCYQLPALLRPGVALVVSPLIALMQDQVAALKARNLAAAGLWTGMDADEHRQVLRELHAGRLQLLYVSPERLLSDRFIERLAELQLSLIAIDEAHCISQWGHDFRPEYLQLCRLRQHCPNVPLIALTATADPKTRTDIEGQLQLQQPYIHQASFDRPNLSYRVIAKKRQALGQLCLFLSRHPAQSGIVYCATRQRVMDLSQQLQQAGFKAGAYHAGLPLAERSRVQQQFLADQLPIVVATLAFGMGIDKAQVRFVVHYDLPRSLEAYYQETGRAGRDGLPAEVLLLYNSQDAERFGALIDSSELPPSQRQRDWHKLDAMVGYAEQRLCRRRMLQAYFGEHRPDDCGDCDICRLVSRRYDASTHAQKLLSCVYRLQQHAVPSQVCAVLTGHSSQFQQLSTFGIGSDQSPSYWQQLLRQLLLLGYLSQSPDTGQLNLAAAARSLLRGEQKLWLARSNPASATQVSLDTQQRQRLQLLRDWCRQQAEQEDLPLYRVLPNDTLQNLARSAPKNLTELAKISGIGQRKLARYGQQLLELLHG